MKQHIGTCECGRTVVIQTDDSRDALPKAVVDAVRAYQAALAIRVETNGVYRTGLHRNESIRIATDLLLAAIEADAKGGDK